MRRIAARPLAGLVRVPEALKISRKFLVAPTAHALVCRCQSVAPRTGQLPKVPMISIVDDDDSVRSAVSSLMKSLGFVAHGFDSAEDFL